MTQKDPNEDGLFKEPVDDNDDLDQPSEDNQNADPLAALVGEGKKFKDVSDLAKGKVESDKFITRLQKEMAELRKELSTRLSMEEYLEKTQNRSPKDAPPPHEPVSDEKRDVQVSEEDIKTLIKTTLTQEQQKQFSAQNVDSVRKVLENAWGREFPYKLREKAQSLGLGEKYLEDMAASHPQAFLELMGVQRPVPSNEGSITPPQSSVQPPRNSYGTSKNFTSYEKVRKENPRLYFTPAFQNEMFEQAKRQGADFYKK